MAFSPNILLVSALALLLLSKAAPQAPAVPAVAPSPSEPGNDVEVIKDVEKNKEVQDLGRFVIDQANSKNASAPSLTFIQVVGAKRWPVVDYLRYFLDINSTRTSGNAQVVGHSYAYALVNSTERILQSWIFDPANQ